MIKFTDNELELLNSLKEPITNIDVELVKSIINKMVINKEYESLIHFLNALNDFSPINNIFETFLKYLIEDNNKECISFLLDNEELLYFLNIEEKQKLIKFLNAKKVYIKLKDSYDYYNILLFKQGLRSWKTNKINDNLIEHTYTKNNQLVKFQIIESNNNGILISYTNYLNYNLTEEEQIKKNIDYLNAFGFNIERSIDSVIDESLIING